MGALSPYQPSRLWYLLLLIVVIGYWLPTSLQTSPSSLGSADEAVNTVQEEREFFGPINRTREWFIREMLDNPIDGKHKLQPLAELCESRPQTPGLIVQCGAAHGGMGNVRNMILNCYRFAIEAGASGVICPRIQKRGEDSLSNLHTGDEYSLDYLFDLEYFKRSFKAACPQIRLYDHENDVWDIPSVEKSYECMSDTKVKTHWPTRLMKQPEKWLQEFRGCLSEDVPTFSAGRPVLVRFPAQMLRFPLAYDTPEFVASYARLLLTREDARRLAATVLYSMSEKYKLQLDMNGPIQQGKFFGAHLRTESDAKDAMWPGYEEQSLYYLTEALASDLRLVYLTSGNSVDARHFAKEAKAARLTVATKTDLLGGREYDTERMAMKKMTWDQQGLIDYEVLLRSSQFGGTIVSSFSWAVSNRRHVVAGDGLWEPILKGHEGREGENAPECFRDKLSAIFGPMASQAGFWYTFPMGLYP